MGILYLVNQQFTGGIVNRIEEIKKHLSIADEEEISVSDHRWEAARLIWEEIEESGISFRRLGDEVGKSHSHVRYMYRTWDLIGSRLPSNALPNFNTSYNSPEVRGETADEDSQERRRSLGGGNERGDWSTSGLVNQASNAIDALYRNRAHWSTLTDLDIERLEEIPGRIRRIVRASGLRRV
jgi:hypothetical protein